MSLQLPPDSISVEPQPDGKTVIIPVFSDIHGRIDRLFRNLASVQKDLKAGTFRAAFITGDLGWFPHPDTLDKSVREREIRGPNDLGFANFLEQESQSISGELKGRSLRQKFYEDARGPLKLAANFYFVRGNHEDHGLLKEREKSRSAIIPADPSGTFRYLADGRAFDVLTPAGNRLRIAAFGGIHKESRPGRMKDTPLMQFDQEAMTGLLGDAVDGRKIDILLTHQGPDGTSGGHAEVRSLVELLGPKVHLHGHSHAFSETSIGGAASYCTPNLDEDPHGSVLFLVWNTGTGAVDVKTSRDLMLRN
jgi:hypothetical protein